MQNVKVNYSIGNRYRDWDVYVQEKAKNSKSFTTDSDTDSLISKDTAKNKDDGSLDNAVQV